MTIKPTYHGSYASFDIYIPPQLRGQGIGTSELWDFIFEIDDMGMALEIWCEPDPEMCGPDKLALWYTTFGFEVTGETKPGAIRMRRPASRP